MKKLLLRIGIVMAGFIFTVSLNVDEANAGVVAGSRHRVDPNYEQCAARSAI